MKKIFLILTIALSFVVSSCDNTNYNITELGEETVLRTDNASIYFDTEYYLGGKTIDRIYNIIESKTTEYIYDKNYYEKKGWPYLRTYSEIHIHYKDYNNIVVIEYTKYVCSELSGSSTIYIPYNEALKIFSENK